MRMLRVSQEMDDDEKGYISILFSLILFFSLTCIGFGSYRVRKFALLLFVLFNVMVMYQTFKYTTIC